MAALTREAATEAAQLIEVAYEDLDSVLDAEAAVDARTLVHTDWASYAAPNDLVRDGNDCGYVTSVDYWWDNPPGYGLHHP